MKITKKPDGNWLTFFMRQTQDYLTVKNQVDIDILSKVCLADVMYKLASRMKNEYSD